MRTTDPTITELPEAEELRLTLLAEHEIRADLDAARAALGDAESGQAQAAQGVEFDDERYAIGEISKGQRQKAKVKLARAQEALEVARARIRRLDRDAVAVREAVVKAERDDSFARRRAAEVRADPVRAEILAWLDRLEAELAKLDARARVISYVEPDRTPGHVGRDRTVLPVVPLLEAQSGLEQAITSLRRMYGKTVKGLDR